MKPCKQESIKDWSVSIKLPAYVRTPVLSFYCLLLFSNEMFVRASVCEHNSFEGDDRSLSPQIGFSPQSHLRIRWLQKGLWSPSPMKEGCHSMNLKQVLVWIRLKRNRVCGSLERGQCWFNTAPLTFWKRRRWRRQRRRQRQARWWSNNYFLSRLIATKLCVSLFRFWQNYLKQRIFNVIVENNIWVAWALEENALSQISSYGSCY